MVVSSAEVVFAMILFKSVLLVGCSFGRNAISFLLSEFEYLAVFDVLLMLSSTLQFLNAAIGACETPLHWYIVSSE